MLTNDPQGPYHRRTHPRAPHWAVLALWACIGIAMAYQLLMAILAAIG